MAEALGGKLLENAGGSSLRNGSAPRLNLEFRDTPGAWVRWAISSTASAAPTPHETASEARENSR